MIHNKFRYLLTLVALFAISTGAWAEDFLYLVVDGTSATMMYGADKGNNPYYTIVDGDRNWYLPSAYDPETYGNKENLTTVTIDASCKNYTGTTLESLFDYWSKLTTINNLENLNTSTVTDMYRMFAACKALTSLDLSRLNTASVTNMHEMFIGLTLETIDLSGWNTSNVTDMYCMFYYSQNLKTIYVGDGWSTASVTNGKLMFSGCPNLPGFDSGKVTYEMAKLTTEGGYLTYKAPAPASDVEVTWNATTKQATFSMPGSDVVLTPQYAPAAQLDENGAPAAVSGLEIAADAAIITAGQSAQGTLLYAVGTSETEKPALTAFAATLPNAKDQTAAGNYYVWYYIQGQDTPQGQEPTAENTFNDSEIMGPVKVELLTNEHTLNIKQSPNITVTVAGTAVTPTDDKVTPVTTGQEVKIKAKDGYKFRKVEVKKKEADRAAAEATAEDIGKVIGADGNIYADAATATAAGATAVAMIAYVGSETGVDGYTHGLALALTDEASTMNWTNATGASGAAAHTPAAPTTTSSWMLPSKDQWNKMITAAGGYTALRDGFSGIAGASNLQSNFYWSSTEDDSNNANAWLYRFSNGQWYHDSKGYGDIRVRACLAF